MGTNGEERWERGFVLKTDIGIVADEELEWWGVAEGCLCREVKLSTIWLTFVVINLFSSIRLWISFLRVLISFVNNMLSLSNNVFCLLRVWLAFIVTWDSFLRAWYSRDNLSMLAPVLTSS